MDSSYYWEVRIDWKKQHILNCLRNTICSHFLHYTFTVFCMLSYYNNQLCLVGNNFFHISLSISVNYIGITDAIRALHMQTSSCKINKLKEIWHKLQNLCNKLWERPWNSDAQKFRYSAEYQERYKWGKEVNSLKKCLCAYKSPRACMYFSSFIS